MYVRACARARARVCVCVCVCVCGVCVRARRARTGGRQGPCYSLFSTHYKMQFSPFNSLLFDIYSCSLSSSHCSPIPAILFKCSLSPVAILHLPSYSCSFASFLCSYILFARSLSPVAVLYLFPHALSLPLVVVPYLSYYSHSLFFLLYSPPRCLFFLLTTLLNKYGIYFTIF